MMLTTTAQPWQLFHPLALVPDLHHVGAHTRLHLIPDQPAVHRVYVPDRVDHVASIRSHCHSLGPCQTRHGQRSQVLHLVRQPIPVPGAKLFQQYSSELLVLRPPWRSGSRPGMCCCAKNTSRAWSGRSLPAFQMPQERTQLPVGKLARIFTLARRDDRFGLQP